MFAAAALDFSATERDPIIDWRRGSPDEAAVFFVFCHSEYENKQGQSDCYGHDTGGEKTSTAEGVDIV